MSRRFDRSPSLRLLFFPGTGCIRTDRTEEVGRSPFRACFPSSPDEFVVFCSLQVSQGEVRRGKSTRRLFPLLLRNADQLNRSSFSLRTLSTTTLLLRSTDPNSMLLLGSISLCVSLSCHPPRRGESRSRTEDDHLTDFYLPLLITSDRSWSQVLRSDDETSRWVRSLRHETHF